MINYNGYGSNVVTMPKTGTDSLVGALVALDSNGNAVKASTNGEFIGVCVADNGIYVSVQTEGYVECKADSSVTAYGFKHFVATADGSVKSTDAAGPLRRVMMLDKTNGKVGFIL